MVRSNYVPNQVQWHMTTFQKRFPLSIILLLAGFIAVLVLIYFKSKSYVEKKSKAAITQDHIRHIEEADDISKLIYQFEIERNASYKFVITRDSFSKVLLQWPVTNMLFQKLSLGNAPDFKNVDQYTFKKKLTSLRDEVESVYGYPADSVMTKYTSLIGELSQINSFAFVGDDTTGSPNKDLTAQHTLLEMLIRLDELRTHIYGALHSNEPGYDRLAAYRSGYSSYKQIEKEFLSTASKEMAGSYLWQKGSREVRPILAFIDRIFVSHQVDSIYSAEAWRQSSAKAMKILQNEQDASLQKSEAFIEQGYESELQSKNDAFLILLGTVISAVLIALYLAFLIYEISKTPKLPVKEIIHEDEVPDIQNKPAIEPEILSTPIDPGDRVVQPHQGDNSYHERFAPVPQKNGAEKINILADAANDKEQPGRLTQKMKEDLIKLMLEKDKVRAEIDDMLKWKEDYLSVATHELKTPVASLKAYTNLLQTDAHEKGDITKEGMYAKMDMQVDKLNQLVNDLLDTTKIQNGKLTYHHHNFHFDRIIQNTVEEIQQRHPSHQIVIEKNPPVSVFGDRERIAQVLGIILNNAIRFCPDVPLILVRSEMVEGRVVCSVQDFGGGIGKQHHHRIFEEFYRVDDYNTHASPGLGLGLFIAKEVIAAHKGKMWLKSREDEGSTFYFSIPTVKNNQSAGI